MHFWPSHVKASCLSVCHSAPPQPLAAAGPAAIKPSSQRRRHCVGLHLHQEGPAGHLTFLFFNTISYQKSSYICISYLNMFFFSFLLLKKTCSHSLSLTTSYSATAASPPVAVCGRGDSRRHDPPAPFVSLVFRIHRDLTSSYIHLVLCEDLSFSFPPVDQ